MTLNFFVCFLGGVDTAEVSGKSHLVYFLLLPLLLEAPAEVVFSGRLHYVSYNLEF